MIIERFFSSLVLLLMCRVKLLVRLFLVVFSLVVVGFFCRNLFSVVWVMCRVLVVCFFLVCRLIWNGFGCVSGVK